MREGDIPNSRHQPRVACLVPRGLLAARRTSAQFSPIRWTAYRRLSRASTTRRQVSLALLEEIRRFFRGMAAYSPRSPIFKNAMTRCGAIGD